MTVAICIQCGHEKVGALTPCPSCHLVPESPIDQAKSITLSDYCHDSKQLEQIAQLICSGKPYEFDDEFITQQATIIEELPEIQMPLGCRIAIWIPVIILFALLAMWIALLVGVF